MEPLVSACATLTRRWSPEDAGSCVDRGWEREIRVAPTGAAGVTLPGRRRGSRDAVWAGWVRTGAGWAPPVASASAPGSALVSPPEVAAVRPLLGKCPKCAAIAFWAGLSAAIR